MESEKLTLKDFIYISTLPDLGGLCVNYSSSMLKLDISPGDYGFLEFHNGYVIAKYGYYPDFKDMIKIFNTLDGDKGLSGTYYNGATNDENHMRLFNDWFRWHLDEDYARDLYDKYDSDDEIMWSDTETDSEASESGMENDTPSPPRFQDLAGPKKLTELRGYNNIPVLFYLNQDVSYDDLSLLTLKFPLNKRIGNVQRVWRVVHEVDGDIGVAVLQKKMFNMMGLQAGLGFFSTATAQAFGNFYLYKEYEDMFIDEWVTRPDYVFNCKFSPCNCDWRHKNKSNVRNIIN